MVLILYEYEVNKNLGSRGLHWQIESLRCELVLQFLLGMLKFYAEVKVSENGRESRTLNFLLGVGVWDTSTRGLTYFLHIVEETEIYRGTVMFYKKEEG